MEGVCEECCGKGDSLDAFDSDGKAPLSRAVSKGHEKCVELFIQAGADVNLADQSSQAFTPLIRAAQGGYDKCVDALLKAGADVNAWSKNSQGKQNRTSLIEASAKGHRKCVKLLIDAGANVNATNPSGVSPLIFSARNGHAECVELLLNAGAEVNHSSKNGNTALIAATVCGGNERCIELLLKSGADVNRRGRDGKPALLTAVHWMQDNYVELLIKAGADVKAVDDVNENAMYKLLKQGHKSPLCTAKYCLSLLLEAGADVNEHYTHDKGNTPLILAAEKDDKECVQLLLAAGANVNDTNEDGSTALIASDHRCIETLLEAGADPNMKDKWNYTALNRAVGGGIDTDVKLLLDAGADIFMCCGPDNPAGDHAVTNVGKGGVGYSSLVNITRYTDYAEVKIMDKDLQIQRKFVATGRVYGLTSGVKGCLCNKL